MADFDLTDLSADELGEVIADAFHDVNDVDGMNSACWAIVAKKVAAALNIQLVEI